MKSIKLIGFIAAQLLSFSYAGAPAWESQLVIPKVAREANSCSLLLRPANEHSDLDCCADYKGKAIAGFILLPVGVGAVVGGSYMVYKGATDIINTVNAAIQVFPEQSRPIAERDISLVGFGAGMVVVGAALIPTGLVMGIRCAVKAHKYCGGYTRSLYIAPSREGLGLTGIF